MGAMSASHRGVARFGLVTKGVLYALLAVLALQIAVGSSVQADSQGALRSVARSPFGAFLLALLALGFAGYAAWQAYAAWTGDDWLSRASAAFRALIWTGLTVTGVRVLFNAGGSARQEESITARLLDLPFGPWLVGAIGVAIAAGGLALLRHIRGHRYFDDLRPLPAGTTRFVKIITVTGLAARSGVYVMAGAFLIRAALRHKANSGVGLDGALSRVSHEPYGTYVLAAVACGLAAYALWCLVRARYEDIERSDG